MATWVGGSLVYRSPSQAFTEGRQLLTGLLSWLMFSQLSHATQNHGLPTVGNEENTLKPV